MKATRGLTMKKVPILQRTKQKRKAATEAKMRKNVPRSLNVGEIILLQRPVPFVRSLCIPKALPDIAGKCIREIVNRDSERCDLCGRTAWLFLIRNSSQGGVAYPIHVRKVLGSRSIAIQCEQTECMDYASCVEESAAKCRHLEQVGKNSIFPKEYKLLPSALQDLSSLGTYRMLTDERVKQCQELQAEADTKKVRCLIAVQESSRFTHFSIYDGSVNCFSRFGRFVVTADVEGGTLDCRCCRRKTQVHP